MPNDVSVTIAALLREREGYTRYGKDDKVPAVDAELARLGYRDAATRPQPQPKAEPTPATPPKAEPETASIEAPETAAVPRGRPRRSDPNG